MTIIFTIEICLIFYALNFISVYICFPTLEYIPKRMLSFEFYIHFFIHCLILEAQRKVYNKCDGLRLCAFPFNFWNFSLLWHPLCPTLSFCLKKIRTFYRRNQRKIFNFWHLKTLFGSKSITLRARILSWGKDCQISFSLSLAYQELGYVG